MRVNEFTEETKISFSDVAKIHRSEKLMNERKTCQKSLTGKKIKESESRESEASLFAIKVNTQSIISIITRKFVTINKRSLISPDGDSGQ
jgi:hypothetical protein